MVKQINEREFDLEVLEQEGVVVVDFFANWCGPCKMLAPVLDEVQAEMDQIKIVKVDVDQNPNAARQYGVQSIPTLKIFKNGEELNTHTGFLPKKVLVEKINNLL